MICKYNINAISSLWPAVIPCLPACHFRLFKTIYLKSLYTVRIWTLLKFLTIRFQITKLSTHPRRIWSPAQFRSFMLASCVSYVTDYYRFLPLLSLRLKFVEAHFGSHLFTPFWKTLLWRFITKMILVWQGLVVYWHFLISCDPRLGWG